MPLFCADNPYVYAGNNPLSNVDPSGQYRAAGFGSKVHESWKATKKHMAQVARMKSALGKPTTTTTTSGPTVLAALVTDPCDRICKARDVAAKAGEFLDGVASWLDKALIAVSIFSMFQPAAGVGLTTALAMFDAAITATSKALQWMVAQDDQFWGNKNAVVGALLMIVAIPGIIYGIGLALATSSAVATFLAGSPEAEPLLLPFQVGLVAGGEAEAYTLTAYNLYIAAKIGSDLYG